MNNKIIVFVVSVLIAVNVMSVHAKDEHAVSSVTAKDFVTRLYSSTPAELPILCDSMKQFSSDVFPHILVELYQSKHWTEEGSPILVGFVWPVYTNRVPLAQVQKQLYRLISDASNPMALRRDLLKDVSAWTSDNEIESNLTKLAGIGRPGDDIWLYAQYGASKLLRTAYSKAKRQQGTSEKIDKLETLSRKRSKEIIPILLRDYSDHKMFDRWTGKILASYRKITPHDLDDALVQGLSDANLDASQELDILDLTCGWGEKSQKVANRVKKIKDKAAKQGKPLGDLDAKKAEKLLNRNR